ncbi:MAG: phosphate ABC transporter permease PstA [Heliobacteriaceae bacterium]|nr:phosphate ABC transporter permease PstA [Heliobacteriaceae bacterium]
MNWRHGQDRLWLAAFWGAGLLILLILGSILSCLLIKGGPALSLDFLTTGPKGTPLGISGGILPCLKGTISLMAIALTAAAFPGIVTAVYLVEFGEHSRLKNIINLTVQCMAGIPSIVTGLFGYALFVVYSGFGISLLAGGLSLGIMVFPVIVVTARDALLGVNPLYRLTGLSLGVSRRYLLVRVILPQALPGILSGLLLAAGYAAGATAPIMVTAAAISAGSSGNLFTPVMALPYHLYILFSQHISLENAYGTALVLVLLLLLLNTTALWLRRIKEKGA